MSKNLLTRAAEAFTGDPVEAAKAKIDALAKLEMKHFSRFRELGREIEAARASIGAEAIDAELAGGPAPDNAGRLTDLGVKQHMAYLAITVARDRRREAIGAYSKAQAAELRARATKLRAEAEVKKVKTDNLLAQLAEHEGTEYIARGYLLALQLSTGIPFHDNSDQKLRREGIPIPHSEKLMAEASELVRQAEEIEGQAARDSSAVSAGSLDELLKALLADPLTLAPDLLAVAAWAESRERAIRERHPRAIGVRFTLAWRRSEITDRSEAEAVLDPNIGHTEAPPDPRPAWDAVLAAMPGKRA